MGAITTFGRYDLRTVRRDSMLVTVLLGPFLYAAAPWFLPAGTAST
jgi:fluoroquinolone transport system permease protein